MFYGTKKRRERERERTEKQVIRRISTKGQNRNLSNNCEGINIDELKTGKMRVWFN